MTKHNREQKLNNNKAVLIKIGKSINVRIPPDLVDGVKEYVSLDHLDDFPAATRKLIRVGLQHEHSRLNASVN